MNFVHGRRIARQRTSGAVSGALLEAFPRLMATSDEQEPAYRDADFTGPIAATWKEASILHALVKRLKPKTVVEIGSASGWTAAHMRAAMPQDGHLICVDPFIETARGLVKEGSQAAANRLYENMERAGFPDGWGLHMQPSPYILDRVAEFLGKFEFVFVDGWHSDGQPARDVEGALAEAAEGCVFALHDMHMTDVADAGMLLANKGYHYHRFNTRHNLAIFVPNTWPENGPQKFPKWWLPFQRDVNTIMVQA